MHTEERRAQGIKRVPVERIVEICGRDASVPAFEAESVELSGRGMHVRTPYLPELGAPLVCRLEERGREIVVEGVVAWRNPTDGGGEFGVKFTALDSGSVEALKELCGLARPESPEDEPRPSAGGVDAAPAQAPAPAGAPVKLHIDGLAAPMKARVRRGTGKRLHVGSNLEFLKVGRTLQVEDLELRERKGARIDSVSVAIDPETQVPQLVVALRYEGVEDADTTPEPSVIGTSAADDAVSHVDERPAIHSSVASSARTEEVSDDTDERSEDDGDEDDDEDFGSRVEGFSSGATRAARTVGDLMSRLGESAAGQMGSFLKNASAKAMELRARNASRKKRVTAKAPAPPPSTTNRRLRPQGSPRGGEGTEVVGLSRKKIIAASAGGVLLVAIVLSAFALGGTDEEKAAVAAEPTSAVPLAAAPAVPAKATSATPKEAPARSKNGIVADVPLFGPTPMATLEPAPLEPPPGDGDQAIEEEAAPEAPDETFDDPVAAAKVVPSDAELQKPVEPWVVGRLHLPIIHRIKLDAPGVALEGTKKSTGFTVFLPKRKLLESGKGIERRDDRIVEVRTSNEPGGARVTFVFQGKVPAYKVRLKKEYVEFFVSSPQR